MKVFLLILIGLTACAPQVTKMDFEALRKRVDVHEQQLTEERQRGAQVVTFLNEAIKERDIGKAVDSLKAKAREGKK